MRSVTPPEGYSVQELVSAVNGTLRGDSTQRVRGISAASAPVSGTLTFLRKGSRPEIDRLATAGIAAVLLPTKGLQEFVTDGPLAGLFVEQPQAAFIALIPKFFQSYSTAAGISPKADVAPSAQIDPTASIGAFAVIGEGVVVKAGVVIHPHVVLYPGVTIGARTVIHSGAVVREDCTIGDNSVIQNGAVIGGDGFGYIPVPGQGLVLVPQVGSVVLGSRVDVGANTCIDRGAIGSTTIGTGTKIDNLVQVGHNTTIGSHSILCGQVGVAGSALIGNRVTLGGSSGVADHVTIVDDVRCAGWTGVAQDLTKKGDYAGFPAVPASEWRREVATIRKLSSRSRASKLSDSEK
jgi:UDP-3-O-[3-hydroxymyristoyl] glucosamine N-acyltransferase